MRAWILCADNLCAKIFMKKSPNDEPSLCRTIPLPSLPASTHKIKNFVRYVVEEIEIACGAGTESRLILCAESDLLTQYLNQLSPAVGGSVCHRNG